MNLLFLQRGTASLYRTLMASETSRNALRFYLPRELPCGVLVKMASLGGALALTSELRWYVRRYTSGVLFGISPGVYCTLGLAREVYDERSSVLSDTWQFRQVYRFSNGRLVSRDRGEAAGEGGSEGRPLTHLTVWCSEMEYENPSEMLPVYDESIPEDIVPEQENYGSDGPSNPGPSG